MKQASYADEAVCIYKATDFFIIVQIKKLPHGKYGSFHVKFNCMFKQ